ncbi:ciliary microtubule inner protein 6-like [Tubulanus polymorphus]|uniref:ciliary microtubule inner protein 6-like n=1 Tax=Tubulanus polymorphus TaxID=672921 RepID=UPI003DA666AA
MTTLNYPGVSRKKEVLQKYAPNTFRVISGDAEQMNGIFTSRFPAQAARLPNLPYGPVEKKPVPSDDRWNNPHPFHCKFLRQNVRLINEPICTVYTHPVRQEQNLWWPSRTSNEPLKAPPVTSDSTYRKDYHQSKNLISNGNGRHAANTQKHPALGIVPVNSLMKPNGDVRVHKEKISYEHKYNCRLDPNYPIRAKRHGAFVWNQLKPESAKKYLESINHPTNLKNTIESAPVDSKHSEPLAPISPKQETSE